MIFLDARRRADGQCEGYESLLGGNCLRPKEGGYGNELHLRQLTRGLGAG